MTKLLECTKGPWHACKDGKCRCGFIWTADGETHLASAHDPHSLGQDWHGSDTAPTEAAREANAALIAAAYDHALIGWAMVHGYWAVHNIRIQGEPIISIWETGQSLLDPPKFRLDADPFGFPILTDDLRARLISEMEAMT